MTYTSPEGETFCCHKMADALRDYRICQYADQYDRGITLEPGRFARAWKVYYCPFCGTEIEDDQVRDMRED